MASDGTLTSTRSRDFYSKVPLVVLFTILAIHFTGKMIGYDERPSVYHILITLLLLLPYMLGQIKLPLIAWIFFFAFGAMIVLNQFYHLTSSGNVFFGGGLSSLFVFSALFYGYMHQTKIFSLTSMVKLIDIFFKLNFLYIFFETSVLLLGGYDSLESLIPGYRYIRGQPIYSLLGMESSGSPLGLKVAPQFASQMVILGIFWFSPFFYSTSLQSAGRKFWFALGLALYPFCMTGTSVLMAATMLFVMLFFLPRNAFCAFFNKWRHVFSLAFITLSITVGYDILTYRLSGPEAVDYHLKVFLDPLLAFNNLKIEQKIFGMAGDVSWIDYTDFGLGALIWNSGLFMVVGFLACIAGISCLSLREIHRASADPYILNLRAVLAALLIQLIGWVVSMAHYLVAVENMGKVFFSWIIAASVVLIVKSMRQVDARESNPA